MPPADKKIPNRFTPYQKFVVAVARLPAVRRHPGLHDHVAAGGVGDAGALDHAPRSSALVVSAYAFSAGASGLLPAGFADRFDRKKLLLFFYTGFVLGTCGAAWPILPSLLLARVVTGMFGGVIGSVVLAIATDLFPPRCAAA